MRSKAHGSDTQGQLGSVSEHVFGDLCGTEPAPKTHVLPAQQMDMTYPGNQVGISIYPGKRSPDCPCRILELLQKAGPTHTTSDPVRLDGRCVGGGVIQQKTLRLRQGILNGNSLGIL